MSTEELLRDKIDPKVKSLLSEAEEKVGRLLKSQLSFLYGDRLIKAQASDVLRVISELSSDESNDHTLRNLLINTIVTSESLWAGSGIISLLALIESSKVLRRYRHSDLKFSYDHKKNATVLGKLSRRASSDELFQSISQIVNSDYDVNLSKAVLQIAGSCGNVNIDHDAKDVTSVITRSGYTFELSCEDIFWSAASASIISLYNPKILCIDGIVETPGEIHNIISSSHETNQSVVIFARGFHEDVSNTLGVNHSRGMLNIIPVLVPYDIKGVNQLVDIAVCSGTDIVSSLKGDLISTIEWDDIKSIDSLRIQNNELIIRNKKSEKRVKTHLDHLQKKLRILLNEEKSGDYYTETQEKGIQDTRKMQEDILRDRTFSLMSSGVQLSFGKEHGSSMGIRQDRSQTILRMYSQGSKYGLIDLSKTTDVRLDSIIEKVTGFLRENGITHVPAPGLICAFKIGIANAVLIDNIGAWLLIDE